MIRRKIMNNKHQENGALRGPLIFTLPASSFVVILRLDWLDGIGRAATPSAFSVLGTMDDSAFLISQMSTLSACHSRCSRCRSAVLGLI